MFRSLLISTLALLAITSTAQASTAIFDAHGHTALRTVGAQSAIPSSYYSAPAPNVGDLSGYVAIAQQHFGGAWPQATTRCPGGNPIIHVEALASPAVGLAERPGCHMWLSRTLEAMVLAPPASSTVTPEQAQQAAQSTLCNTVVHEFGHLIGLTHSHDAGDVMHPTLGLRAPGCPQPPPGVIVGMSAEGSLIFANLTPQTSVNLSQEENEDAVEAAPPSTKKSSPRKTSTKKSASRAKKTCRRVRKRKWDGSPYTVIHCTTKAKAKKSSAKKAKGKKSKSSRASTRSR